MTAKIHPTDQMTSRERLLAAYRGQAVDRLPYWAKVANSTWKNSQPEAIQKMSDVELLDYIHADGLLRLLQPVRMRRPHIKGERKKIDANSELRITHTPDGDLTEKWSHDEVTQTWHPVEYPIRTKQDIALARWLFTDVIYEVDPKNLSLATAIHEQIGQRGVTLNWMPASPLMALVEHFVGVENNSFLLMDYPDEMDELIALLHQDRLGYVRTLAANTPADVIISGENTSTTLISPQQFEKYCFGHLVEYCEVIHHAGKLHELHMCGHLLALLDKINTIPADSMEAFTSPTLGNTRLVDGRTRAPTKTLIGGTNATVWLKSVDEIKKYIEGELAACPNHRRITLTTAGVAPPACPVETFKAIGLWIHKLPVKM